MTMLRETKGFDPGDGWDFAANMRQAGYKPVPSWGAHGWDLGDWPLVVVGHKNADGEWSVVTRVEGDLIVKTYNSRAERDAETDLIAAYYWRMNDSGPRPDVSDASRRGPYSTSRHDET